MDDKNRIYKEFRRLAAMSFEDMEKEFKGLEGWLIAYNQIIDLQYPDHGVKS